MAPAAVLTLPHTACYVLFACYMMHAAYCIAYYVHGSGADQNSTCSKFIRSHLCHCQLIVKCMVILHVAVTEMRAMGYGLILHAGDCAHIGMYVTILPERFLVTLLLVSRFKCGSESECTNSWLYCLNASCELS